MNEIKTYSIGGMSCAGCAASVQNRLTKLDGIESANVNFANGTAHIVFDSGALNESQIGSEIAAIGFDLKPVMSLTEKQDQTVLRLKVQKRRFLYSIILSLPIAILSMFFDPFWGRNYILAVLTVPVLFVFGKEFFINAYKRAVNADANMDTLVALGTGTAFIFSLFNTVYPRFLASHGIDAYVYYESAAVIISFVLLGRFLEERAKSKTSDAITGLLKMQPKYAICLKNSEWVPVPSNELVPGDYVRVRVGDRIPVDGIIEGEGYGAIDESMLTGELVPVDKKAGETVFAASINTAGSFVMKANKTGSETVLSQIIKSVQEAQNGKAPSEPFANKVASVFVPSVLIIAILTAVVWYFLGPISKYAFINLLNVLVIACPCALGLATPTAISVGLGVAARNGILIRNADVPERLQQPDCLVIDKTGTLTRGKFKVTSHSFFTKNVSEQQIIDTVYAIETLSAHPIAKVIKQLLSASKDNKPEVVDYKYYAGKGAVAKIVGTAWHIGNKKLMTDNGVQISDHQQATVYVACSSELVAVFSLEDTLREGAMSAISSIKEQGIDVFILSGDRKENVEKVAKELEIAHFYYEQQPTDKLNFVINLQAKGKNVIMAGDGVNDAPALTQADISIAMGDGTDIASDSSDITLINGDVQKISKAIRIAQITKQTIKQNLFWAFGYNVIAIPIAAGILYPLNGFLLNPMIAGAAMALSSVSVVTNSLLIRAKK